MEFPKYSLIVPVYNRPNEVDELLQSLTKQTFSDFEVILVEDGSELKSEEIYQKYADKLRIGYFFKANSGPGPSRNVGFQQARGNYFLMFDSDCILPSTYLEDTEAYLQQHTLDAWGGPDRASSSFTPLQQAMGYTMSSFFTTGGIRGGKKMIGKFQPRSFNMAISREVFEKTGGFHFDRYAEDIELSLRIKKLGFRLGYIEKAYVYHKRRTSLSQFFRQVYHFGKGRVLVGKTHRGEVKGVHWFPALFILGLVFLPFSFLWNPWISAGILTAYMVYLVLIFADAIIKHKSLIIAVLCIPAALVQLTGYGLGFLRETLR